MGNLIFEALAVRADRRGVVEERRGAALAAIRARQADADRAMTRNDALRERGLLPPIDEREVRERAGVTQAELDVSMAAVEERIRRAEEARSQHSDSMAATANFASVLDNIATIVGHLR